jgi:glycosyltransferase involved in cell wall biosynthesis
MAGAASNRVTNTPRMSVVVASHNARASIGECLSLLLGQSQRDDVEILVVDNSHDGSAEIVKDDFPDVRVMMAPPSALIPELWGLGMGESRGSIIAITTAHFVPAPDWVDAMLEAHAGVAAAVGGAIESAQPASPVDWAVYFCRYSQYMLPFERGSVGEIAGDNASYKRGHIERYRHVWRKGFWEPAIHAELRKAGLQLLLVPSVVVFHHRSFRLRSFVTQRFWHGMKFGQQRVCRVRWTQRALYIALSPGIPLVFLIRIARQVFGKRRNRTKFVLSLPALVLFLLAWSCGELLGYVRGPEA